MLASRNRVAAAVLPIHRCNPFLRTNEWEHAVCPSLINAAPMRIDEALEGEQKLHTWEQLTRNQKHKLRKRLSWRRKVIRIFNMIT